MLIEIENKLRASIAASKLAIQTAPKPKPLPRMQAVAAALVAGCDSGVSTIQGSDCGSSGPEATQRRSAPRVPPSVLQASELAAAMQEIADVQEWALDSHS